MPTFPMGLLTTLGQSRTEAGSIHCAGWRVDSSQGPVLAIIIIVVVAAVSFGS